MDLVDRWLLDKRPATKRAYAEDLEVFRSFAGVGSAGAVLHALTAYGEEAAARTLAAFERHLVAERQAPRTVSRRVNALRSLVHFAARTGVVSWTLHTPVRAQPETRETPPLSDTEYATLLKVAEELPTPAGERAGAMLRLMHDHTLLPCELVRIQIDDIDFGERRIRVPTRHGVESLLLLDETASALSCLVTALGRDQGPLFVADRQSRHPRPLNVKSVCRITSSLGARAGVAATPRRVRASGLVDALREVQGERLPTKVWSRLKKSQAVAAYDALRQAVADHVAQRVGARGEAAES